MNNIDLYKGYRKEQSKKFVYKMIVVFVVGSLAFTQLVLPLKAVGDEGYDYGSYDYGSYDYSSYNYPSYSYNSYDYSSYNYPSYDYSSYNYPSYDYSSYDYPSYDYASYNYPSYDYPSYDYPSYDYPSYDYPSYDYPSYNYPSYDYPSYTYPSYDYSSYDYPGYSYSSYDYSSYEYPSYTYPSYYSTYTTPISTPYYNYNYYTYPSYTYTPISYPLPQIIESPNLSISKTVKNISNNEVNFVESTNAKQGDRLAFSLKINSTGDATANNVIVWDSLPSQLSYVSGSTRLDGSSVSDGLLFSGISIGSLNIGSSRNITFEATVNNNNNVNIVNNGYVRADNVSQKQDSAFVYISIVTPQNPDLNINKLVRNISNGSSVFAESTNANPNDTVEFSLRIDSVGNSTLQNVTLRDQLPSGLTYLSGTTLIDGSLTSDGIVSGGINIGAIAQGASKTIKFQARVLQDINFYSGQNTLTNYGFAKADGILERNDTATVVVAKYIPQPSGTMMITKKVQNVTRANGSLFENEARVGEELQYILEFQNQSNTNLSGVQILDVLPSYTSFISAENNGNYQSDKNAIFWQIDYLGAGASATVTYQVKVMSVPSSGFVIVNSALMRANGMADVTSNEVRTTVILPVVNTTVKAVTGSNSLLENLAYSLILSLIFAFGSYLVMKNTDYLRLLKLKFAILKIRAKEIW